MADHFDPYYKWLGISPQNQPPDLYRLLALERFETDLEVIEAAANRQMIYIQGCATGPYVEHSQKLMNEISAARLCLLDSRRKAEYDAVLRDKIASSGLASRSAARQLPTGTPISMEATAVSGPETVVVAKAPRPPAPPPAPARPKVSPPQATIAIRDESAGRGARRGSRKPSQPIVPILILGLLAVAVVAVAAFFFLRPEGNSSRTLVGSLEQRTHVKSPGQTPAANGNRSAAAKVKPAEPKEPDTIVAPGSTPDPTVSPPSPPASSTNSDELMRMAEEALSRRDLNAAVQTLTKVMNDPGSPRRPQAQELLTQISTVTANDWARQQLSQLDNASLEMFRQKRMQFQFQGLHPALVSVAHETLHRNLPEIMKGRGMTPPDGPAPPVGQQPPTPPAAQNPPAPAPTDPVELLKARGLKRVWKTWILNDEARCMELIGTAQEAEKRQRDIQKDVSAAKKKLDSARRSLERDDAALKSAETSGSPAAGTPEHDKLSDRATESRDALAAAEGDYNHVREESTQAGKQAADALSEARLLAGSMDEQYRKLAQDPQIMDALKQLEQDLGPSDEFKALRGDLNRTK